MPNSPCMKRNWIAGFLILLSAVCCGDESLPIDTVEIPENPKKVEVVSGTPMVSVHEGIQEGAATGPLASSVASCLLYLDKPPKVLLLGNSPYTLMRGDSFASLEEEMQNAEEKLGIVSSRGQKAAWVLQNKFIGKDPLKLCDDLQAFLVSRDVKATVEEKKIKDVTFSDLPCVVVEPKGHGMTLLGLVTTSEDNRWFVVMIPEHVPPRIESLPDHLARNAGVDRKTLDEKMYPEPDPDLPESVKKRVAALRAAEAKMKVATDRPFEYPDSIGNGAYLATPKALENYTAITIRNVRPASLKSDSTDGEVLKQPAAPSPSEVAPGR